MSESVPAALGALALAEPGVRWLAPWGLAVAALAAGALVVLHTITVGRPRPAWLPTARFAPDRAPRAERRLARPADRWLLAIRLLAVALAGVALARPVREPQRRRVARLVLADLSQSSMRAAVRDSARALVLAGDALLPFGALPGQVWVAPSTASGSTDVRDSARDASLDSVLASSTRGQTASPASLSAALVAARRAAPRIASGADSLELVIISPFAREAADAATLPVRRSWSGRSRLVRVGAGVAPAADSRPTPARATSTRTAVALRNATDDDALAAGLALAGIARDENAPVRVLRTAPTEADRTWGAAPGHVLVRWPAAGRDAGGRDTAGSGAAALVAGELVAVGAFGSAVGTALPTDPAERALVRWADGTPAAIELPNAAGGCTRTVAIRVPQAGDAALRPGFVHLLPTLLGPCGIARDSAPLAVADLTLLAGTGPLLSAAPLRVARSTSAPDPLGAALLALAAAVLLAELPLRGVLRRAAGTPDEEPVPDERATAAGASATAGTVPPRPAAAA